MAVTKVLARGWELKIGATEVKGINTLTFASTKNDADGTTFQSAGKLEHLVASRGNSITVAGFFLEDEANGARNAGQAAVEALAKEIGPDSLGAFTLTSPGGTAYTFNASAELADIGGGNDDNTSWGVTLTVSGGIS